MKGEVNDIDLLGLAICHVTCLPLYNFIKSNRGLLCYGRYSRGFAGLNEDEQRDEDRTQVENFISTLSAGQQGPPLATLSSLFPRVTWLTDGEKDGPRDKDLWLKELRICDPTRFNYYFSYCSRPGWRISS